MIYFLNATILTISSKIRSYGKRFEVGRTGISFIYSFLCRFTNVYFSISCGWAATTKQIHCETLVIPRKHIDYALLCISPYSTCPLRRHFG